MTPQFAVSIVLPTYNRAGELEGAVNSALQQTEPAGNYEILIVDNNSTDNTAELIESLTSIHRGRIRAITERRQGVSHARNAGIAAVTAPIVAFFDDDVHVAPNWIATIRRTFSENPDIDCIGGKVLPDWGAPPPPWLTRTHWAPLALQDLGDQPVIVSSANPLGLISANLACRRTLIDRVGGFSTRLQRVKDGIGSLEDDEWIRRVWQSGACALYVPDLVAHTVVPSSRLTRGYHRRWHSGHGRFYAQLRAAEFERTSAGPILGVPAHVYRSAIVTAGSWMASVLAGRSDDAFTHEVRLRFLRGFLSQRVREHFAPGT
jgi:glycosyltransferase involved in cell wall biosynthesis